VNAAAPNTRTRLKFLAQIEMGQSPPSTEYSLSPGSGLPFLQGTADFGQESPQVRVYCETPTKTAQTGDILFSVRAPVGELNIADLPVGIGRGLCGVQPGQRLHARFAWWCLHEARYQLDYVSTGSTYEAVAVEDVGNLPVVERPLAQQRAIADYLDRETARLDALVAAKERLLELLAEKRRALITRAVTRGLHPNAPPAILASSGSDISPCIGKSSAQDGSSANGMNVRKPAMKNCSPCHILPESRPAPRRT